MKLSLHFLWFDFWIGAFYDRAKRTLYVCPLPCVVFKLQLRHRCTPAAFPHLGGRSGRGAIGTSFGAVQAAARLQVPICACGLPVPSADPANNAYRAGLAAGIRRKNGE